MFYIILHILLKSVKESLNKASFTAINKFIIPLFCTKCEGFCKILGFFIVFMYIYKTTNLINGKIYIGQSCKESSKSKSYIGGGTLLALAIKKYGKENFSKEILKDDIKTRKKLDIFEKAYIRKFNSCDMNVGYNILEGAAIGFNCVNPSTVPYVALKISQSLKSKGIRPPTNEKIKSKILASLVGNKRRLGCPHTEESKTKIKKSNKGKHEVIVQYQFNANTNKNRVWTEEMKDKIRQSNMNRKINNKIKSNVV